METKRLYKVNMLLNGGPYHNDWDTVYESDNFSNALLEFTKHLKEGAKVTFYDPYVKKEYKIEDLWPDFNKPKGE